MVEARPRLALIGLGDIGLSAHLPALVRAAGSGRIELTGLVDPIPARRAAAATLAGGGVPALADVDELLAARQPDGLVLATPPWVTTDLAARLLRAGHTVLAEKPIATSLQAAAVLGELPAEALARLQVGLTYRHDPALAALRTLVTDGPLDGPLLIRAHVYDERRDPSDPEHEARIRNTLEHGAPVVHEGAHVFDWLAYLLGRPPTEVADSWQVRTDPSYAAPNLIGTRLAYGDGTTALCEFGWLTDQLPRCELSFLGQRAYAVLDGFSFRVEVHTRDGREVIDPPGDRTTRCFDRQLAVFLDLLAGRMPVAVPGFAEGMASLELAGQVGGT